MISVFLLGPELHMIMVKGCYRLKALTLVLLTCLVACIDSADLANYDGEDQPVDKTITHHSADIGLLSAFFGLDDAAPPLANFAVCRGASGQDGMPVIFSQQVDLSTLQAGDFSVYRSDGSTANILCVTPAPAFDQGELRTILLIGDLGSEELPPQRVVISGNILSADNKNNFIGASVDVTALSAGPSMVYAQQLTEQEWELEKTGTRFPFGGGDGCPQGTQQIIRVTWSGGITKPGGAEVDDVERLQYALTLQGDNKKTRAPFALADLGDGDNNHKLCLDFDTPVTRITFPAGLVTDPREDLNPATSVKVTQADYEQ